MNGFAIILGIIAGVATLLVFAIRWSHTIKYRGELLDERIDWDKTILAKLVCGMIALLAGYGAGYFAGWWS